MERKSRVLIVDDEISICDLLREDLAGRGYECTAANDADEALALLKTDTFDIALLDIRLPGMSGVDLLKRISIDYPETACIMLTAVNDLTTAVETMKAGAVDYLTKPFNLEKLDRALRTALENRARTEGKPVDPVIHEIEAIALGVEAQQDMLDVHSQKVILQTISLARKMGFPEIKIKTWMDARARRQSLQIRQVTDSFTKLGKGG
jgi:DNA-binding NtrC family response regulator